MGVKDVERKFFRCARVGAKQRQWAISVEMARGGCESLIIARDRSWQGSNIINTMLTSQKERRRAKNTKHHAAALSSPVVFNRLQKSHLLLLLLTHPPPHLQAHPLTLLFFIFQASSSVASLLLLLCSPSVVMHLSVMRRLCDWQVSVWGAPSPLQGRRRHVDECRLVPCCAAHYQNRKPLECGDRHVSCSKVVCVHFCYCIFQLQLLLLLYYYC